MCWQITGKEARRAESFGKWKHCNLSIKERLVSDKMSAGWLDPIARQELGGDCYWVHNTSHLEKPLTTRMGVAGHLTSKEK